jgi:predicted helicase
LGRLDEYWKRREKFAWLEQTGTYSKAELAVVEDNPRNDWVTHEADLEYSTLMPLNTSANSEGIFLTYSNGIQSNRDPWVFNFNREALLKNIAGFIETYNSERVRWLARKAPKSFDSSVLKDDDKIKWCSKLQQVFESNTVIKFDPTAVREAQYRPFTSELLYAEPVLLHRPGQMASIFSSQNQAIVVTCHSQLPFVAQAVDRVTCLDVGGRPSQAFPFHLYHEDGSNRRENITDWALAQFRKHYGPQLLPTRPDQPEATRNHSPVKDPANSLTRHARAADANLLPLSKKPAPTLPAPPALVQREIDKWDIFHYTYALLHHPEYRTRYAANLKRELPRIPMAPNLADYARIGQALMALHIGYESQPEYPLQRTETGKLNWRVEKMVLSKDKTQLKYDGFLTLSGIPPQVYGYRLGNRSALEWVIDQYRVSTDARSGIVNDPNRPDDPEYIVRLIGQVVTVSLETVKLVAELATLSIDQA